MLENAGFEICCRHFKLDQINALKKGVNEFVFELESTT